MIALMVRLTAFVAVPIIGVLFLGWDWREIVVLYWLENIVFGLLAAVHIARAAPRHPVPAEQVRSVNLYGFPSHTLSRPVLLGMFVFTYGIFTTAHGVFVFGFVLGWLPLAGSEPSTEALPWGPLVLIAASVGLLQLILIFRTPGADAPPDVVMWGQMARIVPLHLSIILTGFLVQSLQPPAVFAIVLVVIHELCQLIPPQLPPLLNDEDFLDPMQSAVN